MIADQLGVQAELKPGGMGQFDVEVDGRLIFSKKSTGRFPEHDEVISQLR